MIMRAYIQKLQLSQIYYKSLFFLSISIFIWVILAFMNPSNAIAASSALSSEHSFSEFLKQHPPIQQAIDAAVGKIGGPNYPKESIQFSELNGGMTAIKLYTFEIHGKKYVLRALKIKHPIERRKTEILAHTLAANLGIAPPLNFVDDKNLIMIMPYIQGHTLSNKDLQNPKTIETLGKMIAKLHQIKVDFPKTRTQVERAQKHHQSTLEKGIALPLKFEQAFRDFISTSTTREALEQHNQTLCHADLNPLNILVDNDGKIYIIDWTTATRDNLYTDLGYFGFLNGLTDAQSRAFLTAYFGHLPNEQEWKQYKLAQKNTSLLTATVWFDFSESERDKKIPMKSRVKNLEELLAKDDLKMGQQYIKEGEIVSPMTGKPEEIRLFALGFFKTYLLWKN